MPRKRIEALLIADDCRTCQQVHPDHPERWCRACREAYSLAFPTKLTKAETCRAWAEHWDAGLEVQPCVSR